MSTYRRFLDRLNHIERKYADVALAGILLCFTVSVYGALAEVSLNRQAAISMPNGDSVSQLQQIGTPQFVDAAYAAPVVGHGGVEIAQEAEQPKTPIGNARGGHTTSAPITQYASDAASRPPTGTVASGPAIALPYAAASGSPLPAAGQPHTMVASSSQGILESVEQSGIQRPNQVLSASPLKQQEMHTAPELAISGLMIGNDASFAVSALSDPSMPLQSDPHSTGEAIAGLAQ